MNKFFGIGRLVRDVETKTNGDKTVAKFTIAIDRKYDREKADFIPCTAFGKTAEFVEKYFRKGSKIVVEGRWQTGSYDNKDGQKVYTNDCIVESVEFGEGKTEKAEKVDDFMNVASECPFDALPV